MDIERATFKDLVDLNELKLLFEKFSAATGFTTGLIDHATNEVLLGTGWRDICAKFHRACPKSNEHCKASSKELTSGLNHIGEIRIHHCRNGLVDGSTPIIIQGKHFANLVTGQIFFAPPDREQFRIQAQQYGYDEQAYLASLAEVPVVSEEKFTAMLQYLAQMASMIAQMGLFNLNSKEESASKEALLQSVFRSAPVGIGVVVDRVFTWTNKRLSEITGYSSAELEGQTARMLYPSEEEFASVGEKKYVQIKKYGTGYVDTRFKRKDGSIINIHLRSSPIDQQDLTAGVTFTALDITERVQAVAAIQKNEKRLQLALDGADLGMWDRDMQTNDIYFSPRYFSMLGYGPVELPHTHETWENLLHPEDKEIVKQHILSCFVKPQAKWSIEFRLRAKNGQYLWILGRGKVVEYAQDGTPLRASGTHLDITDRKKAENEIIRAKEEWTSTFDAMPDIITIQDKDMNIVRANMAAHDFFQTKHGDLNGKRCYELFTGASEPCSECPLLATLRDTDKHSTTIKHEHLGKFFLVSSSAVLTDNGDIQYLVHVAKDITEQKNQEQLAQQISRDQEQLKHFESLRTMAGAIAHRFNNAMMGVQGNLDLMLMTLPDNFKEKEMASKALQAAKRASLVGSMMLTYLGQRPLSLQVLCLSDLAGECATELKNQMGPSISLKYISPPAPLYCSMDDNEIKKVITNIMINAIESFNNEAGDIEISFGTDHFEVASFPVVFQDNDTKDGMYIFCQIRDTGQGITAENLQRLFEPFFTTKFVGRGLGLALSVGIMRLHHGAVLVESGSGDGTTVRMLLPGVEHLQKEITSPAGSKKDVVKLSGDILLVDDDDNIRDMGEQILEELGFTTQTAVNGLEAVEMVRRQDINYRAVVMDISMPEMDGIEAMQRIKKSNPGLPVLLISGYSEQDFTFEKDVATKPDGFLEKPFLLSDLQHSLEKLLS